MEVRDASVPGENIHILEELGVAGGSLDGARSPLAAGALVTRGGRMLEEEAYRPQICLRVTGPNP